MSAPAGDLLLLRHAESAWNAAGRWQGLADPPLSPHGEEQAAQVAALLAGIDPPLRRVVASDLHRARRTAERAAAALGAPLELDERLRERDAGPWQGLTRAQIEDRYPGMLATGERPVGEGWEPDAQLVARVRPALEALRSEDGPTLVVCHGGVIAALGDALAGDRVHVPNVTGRWLTWTGADAASFAPWPPRARARASAP